METTGNIKFLDAKKYDLMLSEDLSNQVKSQVDKIMQELNTPNQIGHFTVRPFIEDRTITFSVMLDSSY